MSLITLAKIKEYLQLDSTDTSKDALLQDLIDSASFAIQTYCKRKLLVGDYVELHDGKGLSNLYLGEAPILSVTSVKIDGQLVTDYKTRDKMGVLTRSSGVWQDGIVNVEVSYRAGYQTIPLDIQQACKLLVSFYYKTDIAEFTNVFTEGGGFIRPEAFPGRVRALLDPYRRVVLF
jgi:hypothetical protein